MGTVDVVNNNVQQNTNNDIALQIPVSMLQNEVGMEMRAAWVEDLAQISDLYDMYENGAKFKPIAADKDMNPSTLRFKKGSALINKEARFMFARTPEIKVEQDEVLEETEKAKEDISNLQNFLNVVLLKNKFSSKILQAGKDCLIGKRVAIVMNFNEETGVTISFVPSTNFVYEFSSVDGETLQKIATFTIVNSSKNAAERRIFCKKYEMHTDGFCYVTETMYDGAGKEDKAFEGKIEDQKTEFQYIPAVVILNDQLLGDIFGNSELSSLEDIEAYYSRMANTDMDAERKSMNPIYYTIDASPNSTKELNTAPGAYWDLASDQNREGNTQAQVGVIEPAMNYSNALDTTLERLESSMHSELDIPKLDTESLKGVVSSGKTLKALYWSLIIRCDEKFLVWKPALEFMANTIIDGALLYPEVYQYHMDEKPSISTHFMVKVENIYPLPEDEAEEKQIDMQEVNAQVMSRKFYMMKWRGLTPEKADEELKQIALEKQMFEDSYFPSGDFNKEEVEGDQQ